MEHGVQARLQISADNLLCDRGRPPLEYPTATSRPRLGDVHPPHRWREVAPRGQPVPELVEVARKSSLKLRNRLSIYASRSRLAFTFLKASQTSRFGMSNGFALVMRLLPSPVDRLPSAEHRSPFGPVPLQSLHPYYGLLRPCAPHRYSGSCGDLPLELLPWHRSDRFPRSTKEPDLGLRRLQAGCRSGRAPGLRPNSFQGPLPSPGFDTVL